jgi:hypothetical protein
VSFSLNFVKGGAGIFTLIILLDELEPISDFLCGEIFLRGRAVLKKALFRTVGISLPQEGK